MQSRFNKSLVKLESHATTLELVQTDCAKLLEKNKKSATTSTSSLPRIPSKSTKVDLASDEMAEWFSTKMTAAYGTPEFIKKVKGIIAAKWQTNLISVTNISEATQYTIKKWAVDSVTEKIGELMECNADTVVAALKGNIEKIISVPASTSAGADKQFKDTVQQALKLVQDQLNEQKTKINSWSSNSMGCNVTALMSVLTVKSIFSNFSTAATSVLENLKIWSHLEPERTNDCTTAARNILDFQRSKGNFNIHQPR